MASEGASGAAAGGQLEDRVDLSIETEQKIAQSSQLVQSGQLKEALSLLGALEKRCRVGNDTPSLVKVCEASLQYCYDVNDEEALLTTLQTLATRRSQKTQAVKALIGKALPWVISDQYNPIQTDNTTFREKLMIALRDITDGKIFLEMERARLTRALATVKEGNGDIGGAADVLQEVHVETYGSLSKRDKVEFILEQIRLTLGKQDYVRAAIVAGKISKKHLAEENMEEYKVKFYTLMTIYHRHDKDAFELAKDYHSIYSTSHILNDETKWVPALQSTVLFLALSPYSMDQQNMIHRISIDTNLEKLPIYQTTIQLLLKKEIIHYPLPNQDELMTLSTFHEGDDELTKYWKETFHRRIIQHNIRVVSIYYNRIHGARLAQLLGLSIERLEQEISSMVSNRSVYAKIDRPKDIVRFQSSKNPEAVLTEWASDIDKLLHLVETTTHLINKENMTQ